MTGTQTLDPSDIIRDLKAAVTALERHHASTIKQRDQQRRPIYTMIPIEQKTPCRKNGQSREPVRREAECNLNVKPSTVSCDDLPKKEGKEDASRRLKAKQGKLPEMRGGVLYTRCGCVHRDGLQDSCPLSDCQARPECLAEPWPICPPGKLYRTKHPEMCPMPSKSNA